SVGTVMMPRPIEIGSFTRLMIAKNHAAVPRNVLTENLDARKYIDIGGPPAFATIVVNPPSEPYAIADPRPGFTSAPRRRQRVSSTTKISRMPIERLTHVSPTSARKIAPRARPAMTDGARRTMAFQSAWRR